MAPEVLERMLRSLQSSSEQGMLQDVESRVLAGRAMNEDAVVISVPPGKALVQSVDILTPIVNDPYMFGRIAAANALSDIYAMGGQPWSAMNIACFPSCTHAVCAGCTEDGEAMLASLGQILRGGMDALKEARVVMAGGHTVVDEDLKYGMAVTGIIDPERIATNDGLVPGDLLLLTKPLGTGILATGIKAQWDHWEECEQALCAWCGRLNKGGASVIQRLSLRAATDVTGFGLGGHLLEMAQASRMTIVLYADTLPLLPHAYEYAADGLIPAGSHNNLRYCAEQTLVRGSIAPALESIVFDMQTSGGLVLAVPPEKLGDAQRLLQQQGEKFWIVGRVTPPRDDGKSLVIVPLESEG